MRSCYSDESPRLVLEATRKASRLKSVTSGPCGSLLRERQDLSVATYLRDPP